MTSSEIEKEITRLQAQRDSLEAKRKSVAAEEVKILADAFARKLQSAGLSIADGIEALRPYADLVKSKAKTGIEQSSAASDSIAALAHAVLGSDAPQWLLRPNALLGGATPAALAKNSAGERRVRSLLDALRRDLTH